MPFQYARPLSPPELNLVSAGYRWVTTTPLRPYVLGSTFDPSFERSDRLQPHGHHSKNTHFVLEGSLTLNSNVNGSVGDNNCVTISAEPGHYREATARPNEQYRGWAGPDGAWFIEGHAILSPTTAIRFEGARTLVWVPDGSSDNQQVQQDRWFARERAENQYRTPRSLNPSLCREV